MSSKKGARTVKVIIATVAVAALVVFICSVAAVEEAGNIMRHTRDGTGGDNKTKKEGREE